MAKCKLVPLKHSEVQNIRVNLEHLWIGETEGNDHLSKTKRKILNKLIEAEKTKAPQ